MVISVTQLQVPAALSHSHTQPAGAATYITQTLRAGTVQEHAGTVVILGQVVFRLCLADVSPAAGSK